MATLEPLLDLLPDERVRSLLEAGAVITAPDAARPFLLAALVRHMDRPVLAVTARPDESEQLARDIHAFLGRDGAEVFPGWEVLPGEPLSPSVETMGRRLHVLARLERGEAFVVVTTSQGVTQLVAPPSKDVDVLTLSKGATLDLEAASGRLVDMGYERNYMVERRGEFAIRGGILDVFPPSCERPVRADTWGDEVADLPRVRIGIATVPRRDRACRDRAVARASRRRGYRRCGRASWWGRTMTRLSLNWPKGSWRPARSDSFRY